MKKIFTLLFVLTTFFANSQSTTLVISQAYGGGGNTGAPYNADFVELHNISGVSQSLSGLSVQYASATGTAAWSGVFALPAASIPAGGYYLIRMSVVGATGVALPTPDATTPTGAEIAMSGTNGKVTLVNGITALTGCPTSGIVDLLGYGTANCSETAATAAWSNTTGGLRKNSGCTETNNNLADFTVGAPAPRNSATPIFACGVVSPSLTVTGTIADFGNVLIGSNSVSQSYNLSGANLTGAPGNITITAPSTDFQVSNDNSTWGATTSIAYSIATLAATAVWVRFTPQSAGLKTGNVTNMGGGVTVAVNVPVSGTGITPPTPVLSASTLTAFGNICVNSTAGPNNFTINGVNLNTTNVTVGPLTGYTFSTASGGTYSASLNLTQTGGTYTQQVFVKFTPVANQSYGGNIDVNGGGAPAITVAASGAGANNPPAVTTGTASSITISSATLSGSITDIGCSAITVYGVEYSLMSGFPNGSGTQVASTNFAGGNFSSGITGLIPGTVYFYKVYATNAGGTTYGSQQSFTTATPVLTATPLTAFGATCINTTTAENLFTINSAGLTSSNVVVGPKTGYVFSTTATGSYSPSLSLTQPGGPYSQAIYVKFSPVAVQNYGGSIPVSGGGANTINVSVSGSGINTAASVTTGIATVISHDIATLEGSVTGIGCSQVSDYGITYSGISGFVSNYGTKVSGSNISGNDYSVTLNSLVPATTYYYKAYATNNGGTAYGSEKIFSTPPITSGLFVYGSPILRAGNVHYTLKFMKPGHYQTKIINEVGQLVFQKEIIIQVNFIDDNFILPANLRTGLYTLQVSNYEFKMNKKFMIQ